MTPLPLLMVECGINSNNKKKQQLKLIANSEKLKLLLNKADSIGPRDSTNVTILRDSKNKVRSSDVLHMGTDQVGHLDLLLNKSPKVLNKNVDTE